MVFLARRLVCRPRSELPVVFLPQKLVSKACFELPIAYTAGYVPDRSQRPPTRDLPSAPLPLPTGHIYLLVCALFDSPIAPAAGGGPAWRRPQMVGIAYS